MVRVCFPFIGDSIGGSHRSTLLLIKGLSGSEFEPVITVHEKGRLTDHLDKNNIPYKILSLPVYAGSSPKLSHILFAVLRVVFPLRAFIKENKIAIIHGNDLRINLSWPLAARLAIVPFIWHQRVFLSNSPLWRIIPLAAKRLVCISKTVADCVPFFPQDRIHTVTNPFEVNHDSDQKKKIRNDLRDEFGLSHDTIIVGFIGKLSEQKRPKIFIKAAAILQKNIKMPIAFLMLVAHTKAKKEEFEKLTKDLGVKNLFFVGFRDPVEPYLGGMDMVFSTGVNEGFGRVAVECMLWKIPVIASNSGGHREIITSGKNGFLANTDDSEDFARLGKQLFEDPELYSRIVETAYDEAEAKYSVQNHANEIINCYRSALGLK
jgi:glycosyltransferase involved in cell wall biosynthesis